MTKQKVWFEKKPEFRDECPFFVYGEHLHYCRLKNVNIFDDKDKCSYCPLQSIKTHDRELVKEVCEKIRTMAHKVGKLVFCEHCYKTNSARAIDEHLLNEILGQIESEFEQKEYEK